MRIVISSVLPRSAFVAGWWNRNEFLCFIKSDFFYVFFFSQRKTAMNEQHQWSWQVDNLLCQLNWIMKWMKVKMFAFQLRFTLFPSNLSSTVIGIRIVIYFSLFIFIQSRQYGVTSNPFVTLSQYQCLVGCTLTLLSILFSLFIDTIDSLPFS